MLQLLQLCRLLSHSWARPHLRIFYFHGIEKPYVGSFCAFLDHFSQFFTWVSLSEATALLESGSLAGPMGVITFDDADRSVHENALPILAERRVPFCIFAVPQYLDLGLTFRERNPRFVMSWDALSECVAAGAEIGNHSYSHPNLSACSEQTLREEVLRGKAVLEDRLGRSVVHFAYPYGQFTKRTIRAIKELGCCRTQATTFRGQMIAGHDLHCLRRDRVDLDCSLEQVECIMRLADRFYCLRTLRKLWNCWVPRGGIVAGFARKGEKQKGSSDYSC